MEYDIENILSMYEDDYNPGPRLMDQEPRIGFSKGADTSPVYNEKTGHIYKIGNRFGEFYSKTPPKNQFTAVKPLRSLEELQLVIDEAPLLEIDGKFFEQNAKDLEGRSEYSTKELISRKELDKKGPDGKTNREKLNFKSTGKKRIEETNQGNINRRKKIIAAQGSEIPIKGGKKINRAFSHVYPIIESAKPGTKTTTVIDADMNNKLVGYNRIGQKIAEDQEYLLKVKPEGYKKQILVNNAKAKKNVMNALQDLGKDYKGQIGYFQVDPETESFKPKAGNYKMSFAGVEGKDEIYKDMTSKERQAFSKKISLEEFAKADLNKLAAIGCPGKAMGGRIGFFEGQNLNACATKGVEKLQTTDIKKLTPGDKANVRAITKTVQGGRLLKNVLGPGALAVEGLFALPFAAYDYASGRPGEDIFKNAITLGLMDNKLKTNELKKIYPEYGAADELKAINERVVNLDRLSKGTKGQRLRNKSKLKKVDEELEEAFKPFINVETGMPDINLYQENLKKSRDADQELLKQYDIRKQERTSPFDLSDPFMAAKGGIASLNVKK